MSKMKTCPECGSERLITDVKLIERRHANAQAAISIEVHRKPGALIFKGTEKEPLLATVCGDCGRVDLRVKNPGKLYEFYRKHRK